MNVTTPSPNGRNGLHQVNAPEPPTGDSPEMAITDVCTLILLHVMQLVKSGKRVRIEPDWIDGGAIIRIDTAEAPFGGPDSHLSQVIRELHQLLADPEHERWFDPGDADGWVNVGDVAKNVLERLEKRWAREDGELTSPCD